MASVHGAGRVLVSLRGVVGVVLVGVVLAGSCWSLVGLY